MARLNDRQRRFAEFVVSGMSASAAYAKAGYLARGNGAEAAACKLLRIHKVDAYMVELREAAKSAAVASIRARMEYLTRAITTPLGSIDVDSDLCAEFHFDKNGSRIKKYDALRAIDLLNKMDGAYAPEKVEVDTSSALAELLKRI